MNFIQRDPNDPRYGEFHNGENEIWTVAGGTKRKKIKIPSALASGLELIAALKGPEEAQRIAKQIVIR